MTSWPTLTRASVLLLASFGASAVKADDPLVDITLVANVDGDLEVRVRPDGPYNGIVSSLLFTIRWDAASDVHLGGITQPDPTGSYIPISKSDAETDAAGYRYQIFSGVGFSPMEWIPTEWVAGQEYTVAIVDVPEGTSEFAIVNDDWTDANNGTFFVSLAGFDRTGVIYADQTVGVTAGRDPGFALDVQPNPMASSTAVILTSDHDRVVQMDLTDAAGRHIWQRRTTATLGIRREIIDLSGSAAGVYLLRLTTDDHRTLVRRVVKR